MQDLSADLPEQLSVPALLLYLPQSAAGKTADWYCLASWLDLAYQHRHDFGTLASAAAAGHTCSSPLLHPLQVRFDDVHGFEFTDEVAIFDLLDVSLVHGWLVNPQVSLTYNGHTMGIQWAAIL